MGIAEMSRISNRIATISAALGIVLLVILLVILWSNVRNVDRIADVGRMQNDSMVDRFIVDEAREKRIDGVAWITTTLDSIEQNFTNDGESRFSFFCFFTYLIILIKTNFISIQISNMRKYSCYKL